MRLRANAAIKTPDPALVTGRIVTRARKVSFENLQPHIKDLAKHCFLDWLGVTLAGSQSPAVRLLLDESTSQGGNEHCTIVGHGRKSSLSWAALINGTASHALDFDDVVAAMHGHPSVSVFAALLAMAEQQKSDGKAFLAAFVSGFEVECLIGELMGPGHYARGFHATGTIGTFGAAAACAHLAQLDDDAWQTAFGLAATQAAGLKSMFGTMAKPLHVGKAAANGLLAARLAARGFSSRVDVLDVEQGFTSTLTDTPNAEVPFEKSDADFGISGVLFKYHAACYLTHASIEACRQIRTQPGFSLDSIDRIRIVVPERHLSVCNIQNPETGLEGKFSLRYTAAVALAGDDTRDAAFTDEKTRDPGLCSLLSKASVESSEQLSSEYSSEVEAVLRTGEVLSAQGDVSRAAAPGELSYQWERLVQKFTSLASPLLGSQRTERLINCVRELESVADISEIANDVRIRVNG